MSEPGVLLSAGDCARVNSSAVPRGPSPEGSRHPSSIRRAAVANAGLVVAGPHMSTSAMNPEQRDLSPWELVRSAQSGDRDAFGLLYKRYRHRVYGYLALRTGDRALAEDLTHETFVRAFVGLHSLHRLGRPVHAWLITIARNLATDTFRSARYRAELLTDSVVDFPQAELGPEERIMQRDEFERVLRKLDRLTEDQRRCIELRFLRQFSTVEAARLMDRPVTALRALQWRALRCLAAMGDENSEQLAG